MTPYEIPLSPQPQTLQIDLSGTIYQLTFYWSTQGQCWMFNLADVDGNPLLMGAPVVTGINLLRQYDYLGIAGDIIVQTDHNPDQVPTFTNLGTEGHVYYVVT